MKLVFRPLTPDLWPALEDLFGPNGACAGCWCMYWRVGSAYTKRSREKNRADFEMVVRSGPPPGILAFDGDRAVGWCQITPRDAVPRLNRGRFTAPVDDLPVWSVSCFYIRPHHRKQGIMTALIAAALKFAKERGAPALEAYPRETSARRSGSAIYTGIAASFIRTGFREVARPSHDRPILRHDLKRVRVAKSDA